MPANANVIETPGASQGGTNAGTLSGLNEASLQVSPSAVLVPPRSLANGSVPTGTTLLSSNGRYQADFQADGNLVVRDSTKTGQAAIIWNSGTDGKSSGGTLAVQADGNLVIHGADGRSDWSSSTSHDDDDLGPRDYELVMEDNGNLTLFDVGVGLPLWVNGERIARGDELSDNWSDTRALEYIASYPDLMNRLGSDDDRGRSHFKNNGITENRITTFDASNYLAANPDLSEAFGTDTEKAAEHWIDIGRFEGRSLAPGEPPQEPVPALSFEDASGNGRGTITLPNGDGMIEDERIENFGEYSRTGRGTVKLSDGRRFIVERDEGGIPFPAQDYGSSITRDHLSTNESLTSDNGRYTAVFQTDGNFVIYDMEHADGPQAIWATGTQGDAELGIVAMQRDGNLVVYDSFQKNTLPENAEWSSGTHHEDGEANRDFTLQLGNDGQLSVRDSENDGALLWTSGGGHIQDAPGIPRATASEVRADGTPSDPLASEPFLLNGAAFDAEIPEGAVPADYQDAVIQLMTWYTTGFISDNQFNTWSNDLEILAGLQQVIEDGGGRFDVAGEVELALRDFADMTPSEISQVLGRGFDLVEGPDADQLAALNSLAKGDDVAFFELLTTWVLAEQPSIELRWRNTGTIGKFEFREGDSAVSAPILEWITTRMQPDNRLRKRLTNRSTNRGVPSDFERQRMAEREEQRQVTPSLGAIRSIASPEEMELIYQALDINSLDGISTGTSFDSVRTNGNHLLGYSIEFDDNVRNEFFEGFGGNLARSAIENLTPDAIGGTTTFLIDATDETVENSSDLGNMTVIEQGGSGNTVLAGAGDLIYSTTGATDGILRPGGGDVRVIADDSNMLRIEDVVDREDNATVVRYTGDNTGTFQFTDDGINAVSIEAGTTQGFVIQANGTIQIELASGATVSDSLFLFNGSDGTFLAQDGSTLSASTVFGSDEEDEFIFNGNVEGTYVRTNGGNDYIEIGENFSGSFDVRDNAASWMWQNGDEVFENDTVVINGSVSESMQDEGWTLVEGSGGAPDKLVRYDEPNAEGERPILAQITLSGDSEEIENIIVSDGDGNFTTLQEIPPEVRSKLAALGLISSVLMVVGAVFPPAAIAGAVLKFTYDAANNNLSFQNALMTAAAVAGSGNGIGGLGGGNAIAPAWVSPALSAGANVLEGDWANFTKNLFLTGAGVQAERLAAAKDAARLAEGADIAPAIAAVNDAANPPIQFAKLAQGTEAAIMTVEGLTDEDGWQIAEGVFLLGASVAGDGSRQLLLGGADAARIGAAIESGSLSAVTSATAGFLANQGIFNEEPLNIENTPFVTPRDPNKVVGILNGVSMVVGFDEAINNGDSVGQALVAAFPGFLETATNFTGQNPVQVLFGNLNDEVQGRSRLGGNELLILRYDDEIEPGVMTPVSIHGADGREIGEIEEAADGTYNYYLPDENGVVSFSFNHDPMTDEDPIEERAPTAEELEEAAQVDDPNFEPNANLFDPYVQEIQIDPAVFASLTDQQKTIFNSIVESANGSPREVVPVRNLVEQLSPDEMDAFLDDILTLDDLTEVDRIVRENAAVNFLGMVWQISDPEQQAAIEAAVERRYQNGTLSEHLDKFTLEAQTFDLGAPPPGAVQLEELISNIDNPDLAADYLYITDDDFSKMYNAVPASFDVSKAEFNALPQYSQIGLVLGDHAFIEEASRFDDPYTQQRILNYIIISTAVDSPERFWNEVSQNPLQFLGQAAAEEIAEKYIPGFGAFEIGQLGFNIIGGAINLDQQAEAYFNAETDEERAEALRGVIGSTTQAVDPAVGFVATTGGFRVLDLGGRGVVSGYQAVTGNNANSGTPNPGTNVAPDVNVETTPTQVYSDGTPLAEGDAIVEENVVIDGVEGTFVLDDWGQLKFSYLAEDGSRQEFDLGETSVAEGRVLTSNRLADEGVTNPDAVTPGQQNSNPSEEVVVTPVVTEVSNDLVAGTVTTTGENDVVRVEYTDSSNTVRSFELLAGTTPEQASEVLEFRYLRGDLEGLQPGFDPLTLVDGQTVDVIQENGSWYARIGEDVTVLENAVTRDEATAQIRERGTNGTLDGAEVVSATDRALIGGTDEISPYFLALAAPSQTGEGGITATYEIGEQVYTVTVPGDEAVSYDQAETWLAAQLEQGELPGLLPTAQRVPQPETIGETETNPETIPNEIPDDAGTPPQETTPETTPNEDLDSEEPSAEGAGGNDNNDGTPPVDTGGTPESDGDGEGDNPEDTTPVDPTNSTEDSDTPVVDPRFAPIQPTDADGNVISRVPEGELVVIQPDGSKSCGQHACSMVFDTLGQPVDVDTIISTNPTTNESGTSIDDMNQLISDYGVEGETTFLIDIDELRDATSGGQPVIAQVEIREDVFHYIVVDGITEVDGQEVIAIRDSLGQTGGGVYYETPQSFFRDRRFTALAIRFDGSGTPDASNSDTEIQPNTPQPNPTPTPTNQTGDGTNIDENVTPTGDPDEVDPAGDPSSPDTGEGEPPDNTGSPQSQLDPNQTITDPTLPAIDSTGAPDITSTTPPIDLNGTNSGGGRRNWTEEELQEIRDYRAQNNGALPEGVGIADLPTSFIREIAGEVDPIVIEPEIINEDAPIDDGTPDENINAEEADSTDDGEEIPPEPSPLIPPLPLENPIDVTTINVDPDVQPIADIDFAELDFETPPPVNLRTEPGDIVLSPRENTEPVQPFDFSNFEDPLRAPEIGENIPDTPFNPIKIVLDAANQGLEIGRNAAVQAFDAAGARLLETGGFQWLLGQPDLYNDISSNITYDENGNATIDTTQISPDLLDRLSEARLDPRVSLSLGTNLPIASSPGLASASIFASPRTLQRLRRDFPQLLQALRGGDTATVRTILGEAFGLSGDALQGLLDPQTTNTVLKEVVERGLEGIPLPEPVQDAIDSLAIGRNGYFLIKSQTLNNSDAFVSLPNGGWSLTGREIQQTELGAVPALNSAGRPTQAGDFILDVDLPLDEAAIQGKLGPLFIHTEFSRGDLEKLGRTLTIPAGTPIPGSLYSFIESRISTPANITTFSSPGVPFANSQRVYIRARDFEFRADKLDGQPVTRQMIEDTLLHLNGLDDPAYLSTGDLATASASIVSWKLPFSVGIPLLGTVRLGATLYSRSQAQGDPNDGLRTDTAPLNVGIELSSVGSSFALNIDNPKRMAGFQFDDVDAPTSISVEAVDVDALIEEPDASTQASDISVIGVNKSDGTTAFVPAPDTLISVLQGESLTDRARSEAAGFLALYAASPDANVRNGAIAALESLENDAVGAPVTLDSSIAIGQLLQTAADANRIPELPIVPDE